jgi:hypothetical protein
MLPQVLEGGMFAARQRQAGLFAPDLDSAPTTLVEERFQRITQPQAHKIALVWHALDPVTILDPPGS